MRRAVLLLVALATPGCFISVGAPFGGGGREQPLRETTIEGEGRAKILMIDVSEVITDTPTRKAFGLVEEPSTLERVQSELDKADGDAHVKAILLRINSPGGGVTASDAIYTELVRWKQDHDVPIVASLGDMAASGGYYIACAADQIIARPTTVTGSIGVILMSMNLEGLLGKIGVRNQTFKAGEHKDILSPFRGATPEERRMVQTILDNLHARFVSVVKEGRPKIDASRLPQLTDGRIFDAGQAREAGLVDDIGDLHAAVGAAKKAAGVEKARLVRYYREDDGEPENLYSKAARLPAQVNVLPVDLGALTGSGARFMYLWSPGLAQ